MDFEIIKKSDFNRIIKIKFDNILDGFDKYNYIDLESVNENKSFIEDDFIKTLEGFYRLNEGNLIIDFYKNKLNQESINFIKNNLDFEDKKSFDDLINFTNENDCFYKLNHEKYIKLLTKLCTRELFFITFYFYKYPITLWGNYNLKFPLFYSSYTNISDYISIARINKLY